MLPIRGGVTGERECNGQALLVTKSRPIQRRPLPGLPCLDSSTSIHYVAQRETGSRVITFFDFKNTLVEAHADVVNTGYYDQ
jgi:hypothetical protein